MLASEKGENKHKNPIFEESESLYASPDQVRRKWLKEYGRISSDNSPGENKMILHECFNMFDAVAGYKLRAFLMSCDSIKKEGDDNELLYEYKSGNYRLFSDSGVPIIVNHSGKSYTLKDISPRAAFFNKINNLNALGYNIPDGINKRLRYNRNSGAHSTSTVYESTRDYSEEELTSDLDLIAQGLIRMGVLDEGLRSPGSEDMRVKIGSTLKHGAFRIDSFISRGGSCRVFRGTQLSLNRTVAVKEYIPEVFGDKKIALSLVNRECTALVKLSHQNIPTVFDTFSENGTYYVVMEYIDGTSLKSDMKIGFQQIVSIVYEICSAVSYLHIQKINHCDLKPDNILVGSDGHVHLIDFGISNINTHETNVSAGSFGFSAPEILYGRTSTPLSDIYSIGKIMLFLLRDTSRQSAYQKQNIDYVRIAQKASMYAPEERYPSAEALRADIAAMMAFKTLSIDVAQPVRFDTSYYYPNKNAVPMAVRPEKKTSPRNKKEKPQNITPVKQSMPVKKKPKHRRTVMIIALSMVLVLVIGVTSVILLTKHEDNVMVRLYETGNHVELYKTTNQGYYVQDGDLYFPLAIINRSEDTVNSAVFRIEIKEKIGGSDVYDVEIPFSDGILPEEKKSFTIKQVLDQYITDMSYAESIDINIIKINGEEK